MYKTRNLNLTVDLRLTFLTSLRPVELSIKIIDIHNSCDSRITENRKGCWKFDLIRVKPAAIWVWCKSTRNCICDCLSRWLDDTVEAHICWCAFRTCIMDQTSKIWWKFKFYLQFAGTKHKIMKEICHTPKNQNFCQHEQDSNQDKRS